MTSVTISSVNYRYFDWDIWVHKDMTYIAIRHYIYISLWHFIEINMNIKCHRGHYIMIISIYKRCYQVIRCQPPVKIGFIHEDVIQLKYFPRYWLFVRGIHRSPVNSPHKGQWRGALMSSLIYARINGWVNNREAGGSRRHSAHFDVTVMYSSDSLSCSSYHQTWQRNS